MILRQMAAAYGVGDYGRPSAPRGRKGDPGGTPGGGADSVSLGDSGGNAGLYSAKPLFKMFGAVELMTRDAAAPAEHPSLGDKTVLI